MIMDGHLGPLSAGSRHGGKQIHLRYGFMGELVKPAPGLEVEEQLY